MGRKPGSKNRTKATPKGEGATPPSANGIGHNSKVGAAPLSEEHKQALAIQWKAKFEATLAAKNKAASEHSNLCKRMKTEIGDDAVDLIKDMIACETPEGSAKIEAEIARKARAAKWMAVPIGAQPDMFDGDMIPAVDRARAEGVKSGMVGETKRPPYDHTLPQHDAWMEGWDAGQKAIFDIQRTQDGEVFDQPPVGDQPSSFEETVAE